MGEYLDYMETRRAVHEWTMRMAEARMVAGSSGNVSARVPETDLVAITPTSVQYDLMKPEDVVVIDKERDLVVGERGPSFEADIHLAVYGARPDVGAIFHTHSIFATVCAVTGLDIPPLVEELVVYVGGTIRVAEFGASGSDELAKAVLEGLEDRAAVLLRNHGVFTVGKDLRKAFTVATLIERAAKVLVFSKLLGKLTLLPDEVVATEKEFYTIMKGM